MSSGACMMGELPVLAMLPSMFVFCLIPVS